MQKEKPPNTRPQKYIPATDKSNLAEAVTRVHKKSEICLLSNRNKLINRTRAAPGEIRDAHELTITPPALSFSLANDSFSRVQNSFQTETTTIFNNDINRVALRKLSR